MLVLGNLPGDDRDHSSAVFYGETDVVLDCGSWYKISGVTTQ